MLLTRTIHRFLLWVIGFDRVRSTMSVGTLAVVTLATSAASAESLIDEELSCPIRDNWRVKSPDCPCEKGWNPTDEQLVEILDRHGKWLETSHPPDQSVSGKANFCNARIFNVDFTEANLKYANFTGADMMNARFIGADLSFSSFVDAALMNAEFDEARVQTVDFTSAELLNASFEDSYAFSAKFNRALLVNASLVGATLWYADLTGADLRGADLTGADLRAARLVGTNLKDSVLRNAKLVETVVTDARLAFSDLSESEYAPASPPPENYVVGIEGLESVTFPVGQEAGIVQLRELLRRSGLRSLEREATFAIEHNRATNLRKSDALHEQVGGAALMIFFEWTVGWGLFPGRALLILMAAVLFHFNPLYNRHSGTSIQIR